MPTSLTDNDTKTGVPQMTELLKTRIMQCGMPPMGEPFVEKLAEAISAWVRNDLIFHDGVAEPTDENEFADLESSRGKIYGRPPDMKLGTDNMGAKSGTDLGTLDPLSILPDPP